MNNMVNASFHQAIAALKHNKPRQALVLLKKVQARGHRSALVHYNLGLAYEALKQYRQAMRCYRMALALDQTLFDAAVCQGYLYGRTGNFKRELACYDEVLRREPNHAIALYNKAVVLDDDLKKPREAIPWYLRALQKPLTSKQRRDVYVRLAYAYLDTRQYGRAVGVIRQLLRER